MTGENIKGPSAGSVEAGRFILQERADAILEDAFEFTSSTAARKRSHDYLEVLLLKGRRATDCRHGKMYIRRRRLHDTTRPQKPQSSRNADGSAGTANALLANGV